ESCRLDDRAAASARAVETASGDSRSSGLRSPVERPFPRGHAMLSRLRTSPAMVVACVALVAALGGSAYAVTSFIGSDGKIHGCVGKQGQLALVRPGTHCVKGTAISWNQKGRKGDRGPRGLRGVAGANG